MKKNQKVQTKKVSQEQANKDFDEMAKAKGFDIYAGQGNSLEMGMALVKSFSKWYGEAPEVTIDHDFAPNGQYFDQIFYLRNFTGTVELFLKERHTRKDN